MTKYEVRQVGKENQVIEVATGKAQASWSEYIAALNHARDLNALVRKLRAQAKEHRANV